jgi:hypothetical protein
MEDDVPVAELVEGLKRFRNDLIDVITTFDLEIKVLFDAATRPTGLTKSELKQLRDDALLERGRIRGKYAQMIRTPWDVRD